MKAMVHNATVNTAGLDIVKVCKNKRFGHDQSLAEVTVGRYKTVVSQ